MALVPNSTGFDTALMSGPFIKPPKTDGKNQAENGRVQTSAMTFNPPHQPYQSLPRRRGPDVVVVISHVVVGLQQVSSTQVNT